MTQIKQKRHTTTGRQAAVIQELAKIGIQVKPGKKRPVNGTYSGIVGSRRKEFIIM